MSVQDVSERRFFEQEARLLHTLENSYIILCYATFVVSACLPPMMNTNSDLSLPFGALT
jgi:hypothetical protein